MASERKEDLTNMKLLTSKETGRNYHSNKFNKTINEYEVVLQSVDDATVVKTGIMGDEPPIPEAGTVLEKLLVYEDNFKGKITTKFLQPTTQSSGGQGGGQAGGQASSGKTWQGGRQEDVELKLVSFAMSYAKDLYMSTPEAKLDGMFETADAIFKHMLSMYKEAKA
jgi:hypothetical protein